MSFGGGFLALGATARPLILRHRPVPGIAIAAARWVAELEKRQVSSSSSAPVASTASNDEDNTTGARQRRSSPEGLAWAPVSVGTQSRRARQRFSSNVPSLGGKPAVDAQELKQQTQVTPEEISYTVLIESASRSGAARAAAEWLEEMFSMGVRPNVFSFNAVIMAYARKGRSSEAIAWFNRMLDEDLKPDVKSYTAVIDACAKAGDSVAAVRWFELMVEKGIQPSAVSYNAVINSCARHGDATGALSWLEKMRLDGVQPDKVSYNSAIHSCATATPPRSDEAEDIFREMRQSGILATVSTLNALERAVGSSRRDELCYDLGVDIDKAYQHRLPRAHRQVRPLTASE
eukprot:TRINITY_DN70848_c0_g1_i1.p1 TRINITY_DN70848_c0_g1~~TRINITY_DN70848_c0_g1_i1.p1  ORF type:complete len:347 (-),score=78.53 TRINITY_DN70848_c0_g1_i1:46-1086(-)